MLFRSAYNNDIPCEKTPTGEKEEPDYAYNKNGTLQKTGMKNIYEPVQEQLEDVKIENILKRVTAGDNSMLRPDGIYEDVSQIPKDFNSQNEMWRNANNELTRMQMRAMQENDNATGSIPNDDSTPTGGNEGGDKE